MRNSIALQARSSTQNPIGGRGGDASFVNVATFFAAYVPTNGRFYVGGLQVSTESDCQFWMRYSPLPQQGGYVLYNGNRYYILAVDDVGGLHRETRIICKLEK